MIRDGEIVLRDVPVAGEKVKVFEIVLTLDDQSIDTAMWRQCDTMLHKPLNDANLGVSQTGSEIKLKPIPSDAPLPTFAQVKLIFDILARDPNSDAMRPGGMPILHENIETVPADHEFLPKGVYEKLLSQALELLTQPAKSAEPSNESRQLQGSRGQIGWAERQRPGDSPDRLDGGSGKSEGR